MVNEGRCGMKFRDLLGMSISSLWRRKLRTILTILGVVIGTASIVVMISLGLGLDKAQMAQIEQYGGLTTINVRGNEGGSSGYYMGGGVSVAVEDVGSSDSSEPTRLDDAAIEVLSQIENVESVAPMLQTYVIGRQGIYEGQFNLIGTTVEALENMHLELTEGSSLPTSETELKILYGNTVVSDNFYNSRNNEYYWENGNMPDVDLVNDPLFLIFDSDAYWNSKWGGTDENGNPYKAPKKYVVESCGVMAGGPEDYSSSSYNAYCNVEALKVQLKKIFKGRVIPGQPQTKAGKPYKEIYYNQAEVKVTDMKYMEEVQEIIRGMGYYADSNIEWITQMRESSRSVQAALGGIGAVSLFVAAIGIANTMMMSIYERTKEIGVIKVLGCELPNIRNMFLAEAAFIGLIGGAIGLVLSYIISAVINMVTKGMMYETGVSYIPVWLTLTALLFAMIVGMVSGLFPALRAMRLSPLAAIRNE